MQFSWDFEGTNEDGRRWGGKDRTSYTKHMLEMMKQHPENRRIKKMVIQKVRKAYQFVLNSPGLSRIIVMPSVWPHFYQSTLICVQIKVIFAAVTKITWNFSGSTH